MDQHVAMKKGGVEPGTEAPHYAVYAPRQHSTDKSHDSVDVVAIIREVVQSQYHSSHVTPRT